ncbi:hypothetical protein SKAU_G00198330 [Synaphobranchus kaupii]|uniref:Integrase catalytic domain-containing protein n=1 Tax=Synaphobranchus kaupii TaxID=118154 RepID=A0A9Q1IX20_SYNKA|nr:hypothetical protein SKAU_G00198330 [Synaphobranchus kaupii]
MAAARLQRWALILTAHNYTIQYWSVAEHGNADGLSRLPLRVDHKDRPGSVDTVLIHHLDSLPVCSADIRKETRHAVAEDTDFAGPFEGHMFLVVVDAHSKWPEVKLMGSTTTSKTIQALRGLFSRHGLPEVLVSDNGPQFISSEFATFLQESGVKHLRSAPFHPATNGQAERFVQTLKRSLKASRGSTTVQHRLDSFLLSYRNAPHATTNESPAVLLLRRRLRSRFDLLKPSVATVVEQAQADQQGRRAPFARDKDFAPGDPVLVRDYRRGEEKWMPGVVVSQVGPVSYTVDVGLAPHWKRHTEQMRACDPVMLTSGEPPQPAPLDQSTTVLLQDPVTISPEFGQEPSLTGHTVTHHRGS